MHTWRSPRAAMHEQLARGYEEPRALMYVMLAGGLFFVAGIPRAIQGNMAQSAEPLDGSGVIISWFITSVVIVTLMRYFMAAVARWSAKVFGGRGSYFTSRLGFFWMSVAIAPAILLAGMVDFAALMTGSARILYVADIVNIAAQLMLLWLWSRGLVETEGFERPIYGLATVILSLIVLAGLIGGLVLLTV
nr:YIP1 family protein [Rubricella aquisinus]